MINLKTEKSVLSFCYIWNEKMIPSKRNRDRLMKSSWSYHYVFEILWQVPYTRGPVDFSPPCSGTLSRHCVIRLTVANSRARDLYAIIIVTITVVIIVIIISTRNTRLRPSSSAGSDEERASFVNESNRTYDAYYIVRFFDMVVIHRETYLLRTRIRSLVAGDVIVSLRACTDTYKTDDGLLRPVRKLFLSCAHVSTRVSRVCG